MIVMFSRARRRASVDLPTCEMEGRAVFCEIVMYSNYTARNGTSQAIFERIQRKKPHFRAKKPLFSYLESDNLQKAASCNSRERLVATLESGGHGGGGGPGLAKCRLIFHGTLIVKLIV